MFKILTTLFLLITLGSIRHLSTVIGQWQVNLKQFNTTTCKVSDSLNYRTLVSGKNDYTLQIRTTYLNDTNYIENGWPTIQNQVVLMQELIFKYRGSVLCIRPLHVRKKTFVKFNKKITLLDAVLFEAACIPGTKGNFYKIRGNGGCTGCSNYTAYYSVKGELLFENYFSDNDKFVKNVGNYKKVLSRYGVAEKVHNIENVTVFPPLHNGETSKGYVL